LAPLGDLAYKKIFPALQRLAKRGKLNIPVIGVAKSGWTLEQLKQRAHDSMQEYVGGPDPIGLPNAPALPMPVLVVPMDIQRTEAATPPISPISSMGISGT
jgi:hypothetical protein